MASLLEQRSEVKSELQSQLSGLLDHMFNAAESGASPRKIELLLWKELVAFGALVLGYLFALLSRRASRNDISEQGLFENEVRLRLDQDYWATVTSTFGPCHFPLYAYRVRTPSGAEVTRNPARAAVFPSLRRCHSSELCLEWESRLGSEMPFRRAQEALRYFTHEAVGLEDTTIAEHMVKLGALVRREDLYLSREEVRAVLVTRATRDRSTGKPLLYMSSDAHALRRYVDETWDAQWKMANGIRLWCEDSRTGRIIHLGGEYTWGDHSEVKKAFEWLIEAGVLPKDGHYGDGLVAQLCWISDGAPWFVEHIVPLFDSPVVILDAYHVLERFSQYAVMVYGEKSPAARRFFAKVSELILGTKRKAPDKKGTPRKGLRHRRRGEPTAHAHACTVVPEGYRACKMVLDLGLLVVATHPRTKKCKAFREKILLTLIGNAYRMDYASFRVRGYQISSGAMESMHRSGSQVRTKVPGVRWLAETSQAVFNFRMLHLIGRWDSWWCREDLTAIITSAFTPGMQNHDVAYELSCEPVLAKKAA